MSLLSALGTSKVPPWGEHHYALRLLRSGTAPGEVAQSTPHMRLAVYTDYTYGRDEGGVYAERAFALFLGRLAGRLDRLVVVGRLQPAAEGGRYRLPDGVGFVGLPYYESLARPLQASRAMARSLRDFWRALDDVDACWLLGPHPLALAFAGLAALRRRRVYLGVRQDLPEYSRTRHPGRRAFALAATALDACYRALARRCPTIVVGPALSKRYGRARQLLEITVSLVERDQILSAATARARSYGGELTVLSVGRIDEEKNPLLLAEVLSRLASEEGGEGRWRLAVCGEGTLEEALRRRLSELGVADRAELHGYVIHGAPMRAAYESSHFLLHTSWTEGLPQVLVEAFAAGLPVVATDVGGIRAAVGEAAILVSPGDVGAAAEALRMLAEDRELRGRLVERGIAYARAHTLDSEVDRVVAFLAAADSAA